MGASVQVIGFETAGTELLTPIARNATHPYFMLTEVHRDQEIVPQRHRLWAMQMLGYRAARNLMSPWQLSQSELAAKMELFHA